MIVLNVTLCVIGGLMIICRGRLMNPKDTKPIIRHLYLLQFFALLVSAVSWPVAPIQLFMTSVIVTNLLIGYGAWRNGQPEYARTTQ